MNAIERVVIASVMAGTNYGLPCPDKQVIQDLMNKQHVSIDGCVVTLWGAYCEDAAMLDMFVEEAQGFYQHRPAVEAYKTRLLP